jgi:hypothetical protein
MMSASTNVITLVVLVLLGSVIPVLAQNTPILEITTLEARVRRSQADGSEGLIGRQARLRLPSLEPASTASRGNRYHSLRRQTPPARQRHWIARHPVFFGTLVGFGSGFLIGYLPGDDGVFDDFTAGFNGWLLGGVGAGAGGALGAALGTTSK